MIKEIFTWWNKQTLGTRIWSYLNGVEVGRDVAGNRYFSNKDDTLLETVLVSANDELVDNYLKGKINYSSINRLLFKIIKFKSFKKYYSKIPKDLNEIIDLSNQVRLKTKKLCIE